MLLEVSNTFISHYSMIQLKIMKDMLKAMLKVHGDEFDWIPNTQNGSTKLGSICKSQ